LVNELRKLLYNILHIRDKNLKIKTRNLKSFALHMLTALSIRTRDQAYDIDKECSEQCEGKRRKMRSVEARHVPLIVVTFFVMSYTSALPYI
jgi:hypothetical protein